MKKIVKHTAIFVTILFLASCSESFEEINTNPSGISYESLTQMNNHIGVSFTPMFLNVFKAAPAPEFQLQQNLIGDVFSGYMTPPTPFAGNVNNMTYSLVDGWNAFPWSVAYNNIMPSVLNIKNAVIDSGEPSLAIFLHLANIIKVMGMHRISDIYGPIRYSKYDDFKTTGEYDSQQQAYHTFFKDLGDAITVLKQYESDSRFSAFDLSVFDGDVIKWRKFANTLRLRLAMRVVNVDPALAKEQGELSLASDAGFLDQDMIVNTGFSHPLNTISDSWGDIRMSAEMESILKGFHDKRLEKYFKPSIDPALASAYKGIRMGIDIKQKSTYKDHSALGPVIKTETMQWMTVAEAAFLQAEAALRGWAGAGSAASYYEAGIAASFSQHGVSGLTTYLADNTSVPAPFIDAFDATNNIAYPSIVKIAYNSGGTNEEKLEQIITQKWIAMFPDGQEAWSEYRRTGYPRIYPVVVNNSGGKIDTDIQVRRINFIQAELDTNGDNVANAVKYLKGPDHGGTRLWWDVSGSNF